MNQITLETTNICTAKCLPCPREKFNMKLGNMKMPLFKRILDLLSDYNIEIIEACGFGDPFADKLFLKRCKMIKEKMPNTKIYTTTTGILMNPSIIPDICEYVDILKISHYGVNKYTYEKVHRIDFSTSMRNIQTLLKQSNRPYLIASYLMLEENEQEKDDWLKFWEGKVDEIIIWKPHNWAGLKNYREIDYENVKSCGRPFNGPPYIHVDGKVSVCCWDITKQLVIGDLTTQTFEEIYNSDTYKNIVEKHKNKDFQGILCYTCDQINYNPNVLVYSNKERKVGEMTSNKEKLL